MNFPLELRFRIVAISAQASLRDASGHLLCYVKQKAFKLKEAVTVFGDEAQQRPLYHINADRVLDISFNHRRRGDVKALKKVIDAGLLGNIYYAKAGWLRREGIPGLGSWFTRRATAGGGPATPPGRTARPP